MILYSNFTLLSSWSRNITSRLPTIIRSSSRASNSNSLTRCRSTSGNSSSPPTAAFLVIGDEILSGSITDANTPWLAKFLHSRGVDLIRVEYVPDDVPDIANTCIRLRERVGPQGFVFTSGGIGPTHDDKTYEAISKALGLSLSPHHPTIELMKEHYSSRGIELNESRLRMALLPDPCDVLVTPGSWVPLVVAGGNVYILPGIPRLFQSMIEAHIDRFKGPQSHSVSLYSHVGEGDLAKALSGIASAHPKVRIGSYPNTKFDFNNPKNTLAHRVKLVFEGRDIEAVEAAVQDAKNCIDLQII